MQAGVVAAFGLVRGAAQADMLQLAVDNPFQTDLLAKVIVVPSVSRQMAPTLT